MCVTFGDILHLFTWSATLIFLQDLWTNSSLKKFINIYQKKFLFAKWVYLSSDG